MNENPGEVSITDRVAELLARHKAGDSKAGDELINVASVRLQHLTRKMLGSFSRLRQWEESSDVSQNAMLRLRRALDDVAPSTPAEFYGLAAEQIRRELLDMTRYYFGRGSQGPPEAPSPETPSQAPKQDSGKRAGRAGVMTPLGEDRSPDGAGAQVGQLTHNPSELAAWSEFHEQVAQLPANERQIVDLLWYQELSQPEAADVLGVDVSTVKRRWRSARLQLHEKLSGWLPKLEL
jgi:RNA polymerase sigma factor (sigma-70 family)